MNILILEDEPLIGRNLQLQVLQLIPDAQISGPIASVRETLEFFKQHPIPDLILADIQLSDGVSFSALEKIPRHIPIIFTTAFDEFALRAFRLNSIDYLLKPISEEDLKRALDKFYLIREKYSNSDFTEQLHALLRGNQPAQTFKQRFMVYSGKSVVPVPVTDVAYFQKEEIIFLTDKNGHQYVTEFRSLDELEDLVDPKLYYRVNRQFLLNSTQIARFETDYMGKIHLFLHVKNHPEIAISKDKAADFKRWMEMH